MQALEDTPRPAADVLTLREVAEYLHLPVSTVYRLVERRRLPGHKVGRQWRFLKVIMDDWFVQQSVTHRPTILVVDDEAAVRDLLVSALTTKVCRVLTAASGVDALDIVKRTNVDLVVLDLVMPDMNGVETFRAMQSVRPALPVMIVTGYPDSDLLIQALQIGPFTMIAKPLDLAQLQKKVGQILGQHPARV